METGNVYYTIQQLQLVVPKSRAHEITMDDLLLAPKASWASVGEYGTREDAEAAFEGCRYTEIEKDYDDDLSCIYGWTLEKNTEYVDRAGNLLSDTELLKTSSDRRK